MQRFGRSEHAIPKTRAPSNALPSTLVETLSDLPERLVSVQRWPNNLLSRLNGTQHWIQSWSSTTPEQIRFVDCLHQCRDEVDSARLIQRGHCRCKQAGYGTLQPASARLAHLLPSGTLCRHGGKVACPNLIVRFRQCFLRICGHNKANISLQAKQAQFLLISTEVTEAYRLSRFYSVLHSSYFDSNRVVLNSPEYRDYEKHIARIAPIVLHINSCSCFRGCWGRIHRCCKPSKKVHRCRLCCIY